LGGVLAAIDKGFFQQEIADAAFSYQQEVDRGERIVVGVNRFTGSEKMQIELLKIDPAIEQKQVGRLKELRARRDNDAVRRSLEQLRRTAGGRENLVPKILEAVKVYATEGELVAALKEVFGEHKEKPLF